MDLAGVCLTVDALHSLADLGKRVLARGGHVIFVIKGNQPRTYQALNDIAWEQVPVTAATFEADRGRVETRSIQVAAAPAGLKYPAMEQAALIERYTTFKDSKGKAVTRSETVLILTTPARSRLRQRTCSPSAAGTGPPPRPPITSGTST